VSRMRGDQPDETEACCECGAQIAKTAMDVLEEALLLRQQGKPKDALNRVTEALSMDPSNVDALFTSGSLTEELGNGDQALSYYERALEADPTMLPLSSPKEASFAIEEMLTLLCVCSMLP